MGYSCSAKASLVEEALSKLINAKISNGLPGGGFYEIGREKDDGSVVGSCWKPVAKGPCRYHNVRASGVCDQCGSFEVGQVDLVRKSGSFKIDPDGKIVRFPGIPAAMKKAAEELGWKMYVARFGEFPRMMS